MFALIVLLHLSTLTSTSRAIIPVYRFTNSRGSQVDNAEQNAVLDKMRKTKYMKSKLPLFGVRHTFNGNENGNLRGTRYNSESSVFFVD